MKKEEMKDLQLVGSTIILGKEIKFYGTIENPLFLSKDVSEWIDHSNITMMMKPIDKDEIVKIRPKQSLGLLKNNNEYNFLTEDGLYEVCMSSRKPIAKQMKKEIKLYLKQIRLTGAAIESGREEEMVSYYFSQFSDNTKLAMVNELTKKNEEYKERIKILEPKAQSYNDLMEAEGYLQFLDVSSMVEIGRNTLFAFLRSCKVLTKQSNFNIPYGRFTKNGMFKVITSTSENGHVSSVTMVSPKGLNYIYKLMKKKDVLDKFDATALLSKVKELEVA